MPTLKYRDPTSGNWIDLPTVGATGPRGPAGADGPPGPTAVSGDAGNNARLGTDSLIYVPTPAVPVLDHGGLTGLADDDHPHYHNDARGDLRYAPISHGAHIALTSTMPIGLVPGTTLAVGTSGEAARQDHRHSISTAAPSTSLSAATTNAEGSANTFARSDHLHTIMLGTPVALGAANAQGTGSALARADHVHIYPTAANVGADPAGTASTAVTNHVSAADPHTQYQRESEKGAANGYASLDGSGQVPYAQTKDEVIVSTNAPTGVAGLDIWVDSDGDPGTLVADHGGLTGLGDDDHPQYLNQARADLRYRTVAQAISHSALTDLTADTHPQYLTTARGDLRYYAQGAQIDHGSLSGMADDDHPQYLLKAGGVLTGSLDLNGNSLTAVAGVAVTALSPAGAGTEITVNAPIRMTAGTPSVAGHLATKGYVDGRMWFGTLAAYNAIGTKDPTCLYVVTG